MDKKELESLLKRKLKKSELFLYNLMSVKSNYKIQLDLENNTFVYVLIK